MKYEVDLSRKPDDITVMEFLLISFYNHLETHNIEELAITDSSLVKMEEAGYIKVVEDENDTYVIDIRAKGLEFEAQEVEHSESEDILDWIEEYRNLFKERFNRTGIKGSKSACQTKMKSFLKANPKVTKEDVLAATTLYLDSLDDYKYMQNADYFIRKNNQSRLEAFVEEYKEEGNKTKTTFVEGI